MRVECILRVHSERVSITEESAFKFEITVFRKERVLYREYHEYETNVS